VAALVERDRLNLRHGPRPARPVDHRRGVERPLRRRPEDEPVPAAPLQQPMRKEVLAEAGGERNPTLARAALRFDRALDPIPAALDAEGPCSKSTSSHEAPVAPRA